MTTGRSRRGGGPGESAAGSRGSLRRRALTVAVASRVVLAAVAFLSAACLRQEKLNPHAILTAAGKPYHGALGHLVDPWANWDGQQYIDIVVNGYHRAEAAVFFPLYPLLVRALGTLAARQYVVAGMAVSLICFVAACLILYRLVAAEFDPRAAFLTVAYLSLFPMSFFFSAVYTESLFLLLSVACFWWAHSERWALAGLAGLLATLTRNSGILLLVPMALYYYRARGWQLRRTDARLAWFLLVPGGLLAWMAYQARHYHDALMFSHAEAYWHRRLAAPWDAVWQGIGQGVSGGAHLARTLTLDQPQLGNVIALLGLVFVLVALVPAVRRLPAPYLGYTLVALAVPVLYPTPNRALFSLPRFAAVLFPLFVGLALTTRRRRRAQWVVCVVFGLLLVVFTALFARFTFVA